MRIVDLLSKDSILLNASRCDYQRPACTAGGFLQRWNERLDPVYLSV